MRKETFLNIEQFLKKVNRTFSRRNISASELVRIGLVPNGTFNSATSGSFPTNGIFKYNFNLKCRDRIIVKCHLQHSKAAGGNTCNSFRSPTAQIYVVNNNDVYTHYVVWDYKHSRAILVTKEVIDLAMDLCKQAKVISSNTSFNSISNYNNTFRKALKIDGVKKGGTPTSEVIRSDSFIKAYQEWINNSSDPISALNHAAYRQLKKWVPAPLIQNSNHSAKVKCRILFKRFELANQLVNWSHIPITWNSTDYLSNQRRKQLLQSRYKYERRILYLPRKKAFSK